jgi:hypothetical protein
VKTPTLPLHIRFKKALFSKKSLRLFFEISVSILGLIIVLLFLLLGRLSMGPLNLDFIIPEIEESFKAPQVQISASIEHAQLVWREWKRPCEIELVNVHIQKGQNPNWLKIAHVGVSLRLTKLIVGNVSLKDLRFYQPHILLEKDEKGEFALGFGESQPDQQFAFEEMVPLLAIGGFHPALGKLNELRKISIIDANILLKDDKEQQEWELPKVTFILKRQKDGFQTELNLRPQSGQGSLTLGITHHIGSSQSDIYADFDRISFKDIIIKERVSLNSPNSDKMGPDDILNFFQHWNIPLKGKLHMVFVPKTLQILEGACNIDIGKGELDLSLAKLIPLPVTSGNLSFTISQDGIDLKNLSLLSDEMLLSLAGRVGSPTAPLLLTNPLAANNTLELNGKIEDLFLNHLSALWPQDLAHHARTWITENLTEGILTHGTFSLKGHGGEKGFVIDHLNGTLEGAGATITYLKGLPPAQNVKAHASFDSKGFDIKLLSGKLQGITLQGGHVVISNLDTNNEALSLDVTATGPLSDILDVINHKPLEYASYGGINPKKAKGTGKMALNIKFPLLSNLQFKDVKIALKGSFQKVAIERKITEDLNAQLTEGDLVINLTQDQMVITGMGILNQLPAQLAYTHFFKSTVPQELQIDVETDASFQDFKRFGFDYQDYGKGHTKANLTYILEKNKNSQFLISLDTTEASLVFLPLEWEKKPGERSKISFSLLFENGHLSKMNDLVMVSPTYSLQGNVLFGPQKKWKTVHLSQFKGPHTEAQLTLHTPQENIYEVSCKGKSIDLEKFLEYVSAEENTVDHSPTDIKLSAQVDQLRLGEGKVFENVQASADLFLQGQDTTWKAVKLRAKAGKSIAYSQKSGVANVAGGVLFDITPGPNNTQTLEVRANDAGKFLKTLSIYDDVKEGYIVIKAKRKEKGPYVGVFKLKQFNVNKVPVLARFAALLSPMGIANLFSNKETLSMDRFDCDFQFGEDLIIVKKGIGKSISLGFTVDGKLDRKQRRYALKGNVIPARFLNSILSNIPLIGPMLNGGEGEGLFGIAYTISGSFDDPQVSLNPLSILAPGFIRKLFQSIGED